MCYWVMRGRQIPTWNRVTLAILYPDLTRPEPWTSWPERSHSGGSKGERGILLLLMAGQHQRLPIRRSSEVPALLVKGSWPSPFIGGASIGTTNRQLVWTLHLDVARNLSSLHERGWQLRAASNSGLRHRLPVKVASRASLVKGEGAPW